MRLVYLQITSLLPHHLWTSSHPADVKTLELGERSTLQCTFFFNWIEFIGCWLLERSINRTSLWRMNDMRATLRCHAYVNWSVHRGTAATSTTPGLIFPVADGTLGPRQCSLKSKYNEGAHGARPASPPPTVRMRWRMIWNEWKRIKNDMKRKSIEKWWL